jgi:hypothetical protein
MVVVAPMALASIKAARADGTQTGNKDTIVAADADFFESLIDGSETAGHLSTVGVSQGIGKQNKIFLFGDEIFGHTAVPLPAVGFPMLSLVQLII